MKHDTRVTRAVESFEMNIYIYIVYLHFSSKLIAEHLTRYPFSSSAFAVVGGLFLALFDAAKPEIKRRMCPFTFQFHGHIFIFSHFLQSCCKSSYPLERNTSL